MNTNMKKILLTGTALVATSFIGAGNATAQHLITSDTATHAITSANAGIGISFGGDFDAAADVAGVIMGDAAGASIAATAGQGSLTFSGGANTVSGTVQPMRQINVTGGTVAFNGATANSFAAQNLLTSGGATTTIASTGAVGTTISVLAGSTVTFSAAGSYTGTATGPGTLAFSAAKDLSTATLGNGTTSLGTLQLDAGTTGTIGNRVYANAVKLNGAGTATFGGGITGNLELDHANAIAILSNGQSITGNVTATPATAGELQFAGNGSVSGTVTAGTVKLDGAGATNVSIGGTASINTLTFDNNNAALTFGNGGTIATAVNNGTFAGTIGNNAGTLTFTNGLTAANATLDLAGTATHSFGTDSTVKAITKDDVGTGVITGAGSITASTTTLSGGAGLNITTTGTSDLGAITIGTGGGSIEGNSIVVTSITGNAGAAGTATVSNIVGIAGAGTDPTVTVTSGTLAITNAASEVGASSVADGATLQFGGSKISGAVTGQNGILTLNGTNQTASSTIGDAGALLTTVNLAGSGTKTLDGNVHATNITIAGNVTIAGTGTLNGDTLYKNSADADTAVIGNNIAVTTVNAYNGTLTLNGASNTFTTLNLGTNGQAHNSTVNGTGTPAAITNVNQLGTGTATLTNAAAITNLGVSGGTMSLNAGSTVTNVAFTGAGTANLSNLTTAGAQTITFAGNNGTVTYGNGVTFTGSATTATTSGTGNLTFGDGATVDASATLGSATHKLNNINFAAGTNSIASAIHATTVNVGSGGLTSTNTTFDSGINFNADSTVTLASGTTSVGAVSTVTPGTGTLSFSGGPLSINGNLGQLKALVLTDNLSVTGNATAANALNIGTRTLTVGGTFATTADTQMQFFVTPNANLALPPVTGTVTATGIATVAAGTRVNMTVDTGVYVPEGQRYDLVTGAAGSTVADISAGLTTTNTALLHFKQDTTETGKLVVYAARTQMTAASKDPNNGAVGSMLDTLGAGGDADVTALQVRLANFMSTGEVEAMLSTLTPDVSGGAIGGLTTVGGSTANIIGDRVASLRNADGYETGMVAGNAFDNYHFWGQVFGAKADQDRRNFIAGYEADTYGFVGGVDTNVTDDFRLGAAFAYADTDVDSEDSNRTKTDIDSYQLSVYGDLDLKDNVFLSGQVSYLYGDIETRRHNVGGIAGNTARADFHSSQYGARAELGRKFAVDSNFTLTPSLLANYSHIDIDSYSEKGAGGLSLRNVKTDDMDILELGVNLIAEATYADLQGGLIKPNLHVGYRHDFIGDTVSTLGGLAGGGAAFRTNGADPAQNTVNVGAGIKWQLQNNLEFTANYDYEHKSDYDAHSGYVRAGYKF